MNRSSTVAVLLILAAAGWLQGQGVPGVSGDAFPGASWEKAPSLEALGWSPAGVAALKASVDSAGSAAFMIVTPRQGRANPAPGSAPINGTISAAGS